MVVWLLVNIEVSSIGIAVDTVNGNCIIPYRKAVVGGTCVSGMAFTIN